MTKEQPAKTSAVGDYIAPSAPVHETPRSPGLTAQQLGTIYAQVLHNISVTRAAGMYTDHETQAMADAVRQFHELLSAALCERA